MITIVIKLSNIIKVTKIMTTIIDNIIISAIKTTASIMVMITVGNTKETPIMILSKKKNENNRSNKKRL